MKITDVILPVTFAVSTMFLSPGSPAADEPHHQPDVSTPAKDIAKDESKPAAKPAAESKEADPMSRILAKETGAEFEASFLDLMSQHHHVGIRMAGLASTNTENTALRELAAATIQTQGKEADQMEKWLREWHKQPPRVQKVPDDVTQAQEKALGELAKAKGAEFDKEFARAMTLHHQHGTAMAKLAIDRATHEEVKKLAVVMANNQQTGIEALSLIAK